MSLCTASVQVASVSSYLQQTVARRKAGKAIAAATPRQLGSRLKINASDIN